MNKQMLVIESLQAMFAPQPGKAETQSPSPATTNMPLPRVANNQPMVRDTVVVPPRVISNQPNNTPIPTPVPPHQPIAQCTHSSTVAMVAHTINNKLPPKIYYPKTVYYPPVYYPDIYYLETILMIQLGYMPYVST